MIYWELFQTFFLIGALTFGGGYAMLPLIQAEVTARGWLAEEAVVNFIAVSESTPGPFAVNMATYVGSEMGGALGAVCATLGVVLPSFVIILIVAKCYDAFRASKLVKGVMSGLKPAVVGMIGTAVLSVGKTVFAPNGWDMELLTAPETWVSLGIFAIASVLAFRKMHPIAVICIAAVLGIGAGILGI